MHRLLQSWGSRIGNLCCSTHYTNLHGYTSNAALLLYSIEFNSGCASNTNSTTQLQINSATVGANCTNNSPRPNHGGIVPTFKYCHVAQAFHRHQTIRQAPNQTESSNTLDDQRTFKTWTTQASGFVLFNFVSYN